MPPCTASTSAIHGTQVTTNMSPCRNPHKKATRARVPSTLKISTARQNHEKKLECASRNESDRIAPLNPAKVSRTIAGVFEGSNAPRNESQGRDAISAL